MDPSDSSPVPRQLRLLAFLSRPGIAFATAGKTRSPRFRRVPFLRDVALDPGRATAPRITAPHMLPSTLLTASAPATYRFRGSIPHPTGSLCTLRRGRHLHAATLATGRALPLTRAGLSPAGTRQLSWRTKGRHFEALVILQAFCWYLRYPLSYRDIEELFRRRLTHRERPFPGQAADAADRRLSILPHGTTDDLGVRGYAVAAEGLWVRRRVDGV